ncbi:META domain-containing protein [Nocardia sp. 2]|uniref:META domain-containing protein n=1 Tax=Nocardia acididurans TaxID=2802282 RepID=A0ABS1M7Q2_9NOCA|nr:META domain-containing protein [Nocardia acididurans]MBL1076574.1 META domain-containing protein [Nocardia acididurans]
MSATRRWCALLALTAGALAGCSSGDDEPKQPAETPMGKAYISTEVTGTPIPGGGPLTLTFADDRLTANAGCNTATGPVTLDGGTLTIGEMATTMMGCPGETAGADGWVDSLLKSSPTWKLDGPTLTLTGNGDGITVTLLDRKVAAPDKPLTGTAWIVSALLTKDAHVRSQTLDEVRPTLTIAPDGNVSGNAGCNSMIGKAEIAGSYVTFQIGTTKMACAPDVMEVESQVLAVLNGKTITTIDSSQLTIRNETTGTGLELRAE